MENSYAGVNYLGPRGTRKEFFLKLIKRLDFPTYRMHIMEDRKGRKAMFYNMKLAKNFKGPEPITEGDCLLMKATVANYREYKDIPQTYLNRIIVLENKGGASETVRATWQNQLAGNSND